MDDEIAALEERVRRRADAQIAARILHHILSPGAIARNDDHVIVRIERGAFLGNDAYLVFDVQNRSDDAYRLAHVAVRAGRRDVAGVVRFGPGGAGVTDDGDLGVVPAGARRSGVVAVRGADRVRDRSLTVVVSDRGRRRPVVVRDVALR